MLNIHELEYALNVRLEKTLFQALIIIYEYTPFQVMVKRMFLIPCIKRTFFKMHV